MEKKYYILFGGIVFAAILLLAAYAANQKQPKIVLSEYSFDAGSINPDDGIWKGEFNIRNEGEAALVIEGISTSCGCTKAKADEETIEPGRETKLTVTYDPSTHPGLTGKIERVVYISSNDPENREVGLKITANVLPSGEENE